MKKTHWRTQEAHYKSLLSTLPRKIRKDAEDLVKVFFIRKSKRLRLTDNYLIKLWECSRATAQRRLAQLEEHNLIRRWTSNPQKRESGFFQFRYLFLVSQKKTQLNKHLKDVDKNLTDKVKSTPLTFEDYLSMRTDVPLKSFLFWMRRWKCNPASIGYLCKVWEKIKVRADVLESILWCANEEQMTGKKRVGFIINEINARA